MDNATGGAERYRIAGRRRLRFGSLALSALLTMHSRVPAYGITSGYVVFMLSFMGAVVVLASPMRHFEVYVGQWSLSGPGRAFRLISLFDGIGIAMCLNALFRAINNCAVAAIAAMYVLRALRDEKLPFTYCRDFNLKPYNPEVKEVRYIALRGIRILVETDASEGNSSTLGLLQELWKNASEPKLRFVEVVKLRPDFIMQDWNTDLILLLLGVWIIIWFTMFSERWLYHRLVWNNMPQWIIIIPCVWTILIVFIGLYNSEDETVRKAFRFGKKEIMFGLSDAFEVSLYTHAASVGTEIITGKGLNRYASGHIDPLLNNDNLWHSFLVALLSGMHVGGALLCSAADQKHQSWNSVDGMSKSTLWIFPVYSKCTSLGNYSHFTTVCVFFGLTFSYITVAYVFLKTALHAVFEYKIKLVFREQLVVTVLVLSCALLSVFSTTYGGLALMESVEVVMTGVAMPLICLLELVALLYMYRSSDFTSDMNVAMEDSACASRLGIQWQLLPLFTLATLISKVVALFNSELPQQSMWMATVPLACAVLALPLRALYNTYTYIATGRRN